MKTVTKYYGEQEINDEDILTFLSGLPGFENERRFIIQPFGEAFSVLQSLDHVEVAFIITSPFLFFDSYSVDLPDHFVNQLDIKSEKEVEVWNIVSVQTPFSDSTINLKAPIIINPRKKTGKQYIPDISPYDLRQPLMPDSDTAKEKGVK